MDHPHVAKVLDAGADELGRPYFVMEYVPGRPITHFADERRLTVRQRLGLFAQACEAVAHAHTKGLIHRDVKAGNVLAYLADGEPTVKVIDFGIAKALTGDRLTDRTLNTFHGQAIGTYESMSPEQADGSPDIDTRADVYALGALLYELLAGTQPFDRATLAAAGDAEVRRIIREVEPPRPSARLTGLGGEAGAQAAAARQGAGRGAGEGAPVGAGWIPLKAMRKDRDRRYAGPLELAADLRNYLEGRPLLAAPESRAYRVRKAVRRNRGAVLTAAAVVALAAAGTGLYVRGIKARSGNAGGAGERGRGAGRGRARAGQRAADAAGGPTSSGAAGRGRWQAAEQKDRESRGRLADGLLAQGDALKLAGQWAAARDRYEESREVSASLGAATAAATTPCGTPTTAPAARCSRGRRPASRRRTARPLLPGQPARGVRPRGRRHAAAVVGPAGGPRRAAVRRARQGGERGGRLRDGRLASAAAATRWCGCGIWRAVVNSADSAVIPDPSNGLHQQRRTGALSRVKRRRGHPMRRAIRQGRTWVQGGRLAPHPRRAVWRWPARPVRVPQLAQLERLPRAGVGRGPGDLGLVRPDDTDPAELVRVIGRRVFGGAR
jgi:hypothetical protein